MNVLCAYNFTDFPQAKKKKAKFVLRKPVTWGTFHWMNYLNTATGNNTSFSNCISKIQKTKLLLQIIYPQLFIQNVFCYS